MSNLRIGISLYGLSIVVLQALPNILWRLFPPSVDSLDGNSSSVPFIEYGEHILGVVTVVTLVILIQRGHEKEFPRGKAAIAAYAAIGLYWLCWALYFCEVQPLFVIYAMVVLPPIAFSCAGLAERVFPVSILSAVFAVFHVVVCLENFPIGG
ncbi:MAG: hypothetical protein LBK72_07280 [Bifidobacteriaceae bacterium]|nr:hypothetical protein [Bifidobacteriaceae bacterium]